MGNYSHGIQIKERTISLSNLAIFLAGAIWLVTLLGSEKWQDNNSIKDDVIYYYSYLPALFIYQDLSFGFTDELPEEIATKIWVNTDSGIPKMTIGLSIMYSPFFLMAHGYSKLRGTPNGYSAPYHLMLLFAGLFYGIMGLFVLKKILLIYFDQLVVALSVFCISLGTNLYHYVGYDGAMSHVYSFFLFAVFVYYSLVWNKNPNNINSLIMGIAGGLIVLVRPANCLIWILPFLIAVQSTSTLKTKIDWLIQNHRNVLLFAFSLLFVLMPQLLYWKYFTGQWLYYGYGAESFYFGNPHIIDGLFSYRKGWLLYTPIMFFAIAGLLKIKQYCSNIFFFLLLYVPLNLYLVFSWWCWWYGGSFGARSLIETYVVLSFPLAVFITQVLKYRSLFLKGFLGLLAGFFLLLNVFQSKQYDVAILHWDGMTKDAYWAIFGQSERPENYLNLISDPDYESALLGNEELINDD